MAIKLSAAARNAMLDALATETGSGALLRIYSGTRPANVAAALSGNTLLAELVCETPFAGSASGGVLTLGTVDPGEGVADGTPTFFRLFKSDGTTAVADGSVGTSGTDLILGAATIATGVDVTVTAGTFTAGNA